MSSEPFDPYLEWLGIPPEERPPNNYRLLGLVPLESDAVVIASAGDQRIAELQALADGPHGPDAQKLVKRVTAARACLLDPQQKSVYDDALRAVLTATGKAVPDAPRLSAGGKPVQGALLGDYLLLGHLSDSKSGSVWRARHQTEGRVVTLKLLPPEAARNPTVRKRFEREAQLCARVSHPHVVGGGSSEPVEAAGIHYLVLEDAEGEDLASLVVRKGPLDVNKAVDYVRQAAEGLSYLHEQKIYHRNVKPANLVVDKQGTVRVSNMLMARLDDATDEEGGARLTHTGDMLGTVDYLAPEQADDAHTADQRADIYSLGCTLFHLLVGRPPYPEANLVKKMLAHRQQPIPSLRAMRPDVPDSVDACFQRMLAKQPHDRQQSMAEVVMVLTTGQPAMPTFPSMPDLPPAPPKKPATPKPTRRGVPVGLWVAIGLTVLAVTVVTAVVVQLLG